MIVYINKHAGVVNVEDNSLSHCLNLLKPVHIIVVYFNVYILNCWYLLSKLVEYQLSVQNPLHSYWTTILEGGSHVLAVVSALSAHVPSCALHLFNHSDFLNSLPLPQLAVATSTKSVLFSKVVGTFLHHLWSNLRPHLLPLFTPSSSSHLPQVLAHTKPLPNQRPQTWCLFDSPRPLVTPSSHSSLLLAV